MTLEYELTKQDYIALNLFQLTYSKSIKWNIFIQRYIVSLSFLFFPFVLVRITAIPLWYWFSIFIGLYVIWVIYYPKRVTRLIEKRISKMLDKGKNQELLGMHKLTLTDEALVNVNGLSETVTKYSTVENIVDTKDHIFIYISAVMAIIIPVRIFEDQIKKDEFLSALRQKVDLK